MLSVLEQALSDAALGADAPRAGVLRDAVLAWMENREDSYMFSFQFICEHFKLSPSAVRAAVRRRHVAQWTVPG